MSRYETTAAPARDEAVALFLKGRTVRQIAGELDCSTQRVYQLLARARELGELPDKEGAA
jgi:DNA-directed RNA polymerase specialized sigma24 family protein